MGIGTSTFEPKLTLPRYYVSTITSVNIKTRTLHQKRHRGKKKGKPPYHPAKYALSNNNSVNCHVSSGPSITGNFGPQVAQLRSTFLKIVMQRVDTSSGRQSLHNSLSKLLQAPYHFHAEFLAHHLHIRPLPIPLGTNHNPLPRRCSST